MNNICTDAYADAATFVDISVWSCNIGVSTIGPGLADVDYVCVSVSCKDVCR